MRSGMENEDKSVVSDLAKAISSLDISKVASLLSDAGSFAVQDKNYKVFRSDKRNSLIGFMEVTADLYLLEKYDGNSVL